MKSFLQAVPADLDTLYALYADAREFMRQTGNPNQWKDDRPQKASIQKDVQEGNLWLVMEDGEVAGAFSLIIGTDPTYLYIEEGSWLSDRPYGAIHKIVSARRSHSVFDAIVRFCEKRVFSLRIDTHPDNRIMQHLIAKNGFTYCGHIYTDDHTLRLAYQKDLDS